jgi:hypothetical protein
MMWVVIFHLACLAVTLELIYRAPECDARGNVVRHARRPKRVSRPMTAAPLAREPFEASREAP